MKVIEINCDQNLITVHEKSILLPLLPASLLAFEEPFLYRWLTHYALLSMFPLLVRDKLSLPYVALSFLFILLYYAPGRRKEGEAISLTNLKPFLTLSLLSCSLTLHIIYLTVTPPEKYPFLFEFLIMLLCFSQFVLLTIYTNIKQWKLLRQFTSKDKEKKLIWFCFWGYKVVFLWHFVCLFS